VELADSRLQVSFFLALSFLSPKMRLCVAQNRTATEIEERFFFFSPSLFYKLSPALYRRPKSRLDTFPCASADKIPSPTCFLTFFPLIVLLRCADRRSSSVALAPLPWKGRFQHLSFYLHFLFSQESFPRSGLLSSRDSNLNLQSEIACRPALAVRKSLLVL